MADFETWLLEHNYRSSTAHKSAQDIERLRRWYADGYEPSSDSDMQAVKRFASYLQDVKPPTRGGFDGWVRSLQLPPLPQLKAKTGPTQQTQSMVEEDWQTLLVVLKKDPSREGCVLYVMAATGHRIGDILRLDRQRFAQGMRTGILQMERKGGSYIETPLAGAQPIWDALQTRWDRGATVADWVAPGGLRGAEAGGAAYKRVQRHLKRIGVTHGLSGRVHLHRLRRTVGVRALHHTKDIHAVQQLLGHRSLRSTEQYVSELRADDVVALQRKLLGTT